MNVIDGNGYLPWPNAACAAMLFSVDVPGTVGVSLRARQGPVRDVWIEFLRNVLPESTVLRRIPHHVSDAGLIGGLDLAATLQCGRPIAERGLLARADGGILILTSAERTSPSLAARIGETLDTHKVASERDGLAAKWATRFGLVMLDESVDEERPPHILLDRVAFHVNLEGIRQSDVTGQTISRNMIAEARSRLDKVKANREIVRSLCKSAWVLGITSIRAPLFALRVARAAAALEGRYQVSNKDAALAAALVLAPRATRLPAAGAPQPADQNPAPDVHDCADREGTDSSRQDDSFDEIIIEAAQAAIPPDVLAQLQFSTGRIARSHAMGRTGLIRSSLRQGRPAGVRRGELRNGARLNVVETLRAAAPWQPLRRREASQSQLCPSPGRRIDVRRDDFRVTQLQQRSETTSIFAVDASGSSALHRLAEAKGAVEQLLADCYIRRDRVALLAFRGSKAELILPPTRSLARAKRSLASLPGGGGTPLAAAIDAALALADVTQRKGQAPLVVLLTDGRANVARNGATGRKQAELDAIESARLIRLARLPALVIDISPRPRELAENLAKEMGAQYLPLPGADAKTLSLAVQAASDIKVTGRH